MRYARRSSKKAVLVRDKLYLNNQLFTAGISRHEGEKHKLSLISWNVEGLRSSLDDEDFDEFVTSYDILFFGVKPGKQG